MSKSLLRILLEPVHELYIFVAVKERERERYIDKGRISSTLIHYEGDLIRALRRQRNNKRNQIPVMISGFLPTAAQLSQHIEDIAFEKHTNT